MKIIRNAGRDSQVWELQEDNGELVGTFKSRDEAEKAMGMEKPVEAAPVVEEEEVVDVEDEDEELNQPNGKMLWLIFASGELILQVVEKRFILVFGKKPFLYCRGL